VSGGGEQIEMMSEEWQTFKHVLDENTALDDLFIGVKLFIVRSDEEDHFLKGARSGWLIKVEEEARCKLLF
jgi:hypothetical protein